MTEPNVTSTSAQTETQKVPKALRHPLASPDDSVLITALNELANKAGKLVKSHVYAAPGDPDIQVKSWKMNEFKYYDVPSPFPTLARGLFTYKVDNVADEQEGKSPTEYRIVARGYDKFFNIGEVPWTTWDSITNNTAAPYTLSLKSNGCIIFIGALTPEKLLITSKHSVGRVEGVEKSHAEAGEEWLRRYLENKGKTEEALARKLWDNNWTAIAELCDDNFEEHVLAYPPELTGLHLHGLNTCTKEFATLPHAVVDKFAEEWGFIRTKSITLNSIQEVREFTDNVAKTQHWEGEAVEGFVVRTHVAESTKDRKSISPYAPGSTFFFKVKFDEPYLMYRDWREVTKMLLSQGVLSASSLPHHKMKRPETKVYVKWVIEEIKRDRAQFDQYTKGKGIIATRERFLEWLKMHGEEDLAAEDGQKTKPTVFGEKTIIVPVAIPGCGKTAVAVALRNIFGFGHTQSDDVQAKKAAPVFLKNVSQLLKKQDIVIADKNNHLAEHRTQLREIARSYEPPARLIALNWSIADKPQSSIHRVCGDRIVSRGDNHQKLQADKSPEKSHEGVLWQFINNAEPLAEDEVDTVIELDLEDDFETTLHRTIEGICSTLGLEKPTPEKVTEGINVAFGYKARTKKKPEAAATTKKKEPRYFAILPELNVEELLDKVFGADLESDTLWTELKEKQRVIKRPHITLVHMKSLPEEIELWERCMELHAMDAPPVFGFQVGSVVWNDRVMSLCIENVKLVKQGDDSQKGEEFIGKMRDDLRERLHITVGTADGTIMPVEGKTLVENWKAGQRDGIRSLEFDAVQVTGRVKGLIG